MSKKTDKTDKDTAAYDSQRQQNVLLEKIYSEVKTIGEGHDGIVKRLDRVEKKLEQHDNHFEKIESELGSVKSELDSVEIAVRENGRKIKRLERGHEEIKQKLDIVTSDHESRLQKIETGRGIG